MADLLERVQQLRQTDTWIFSTMLTSACLSLLASFVLSVFGFPNAFLGLIAEPVVITLAVASPAGVRFPRGFMFAAQMIYTLGFLVAYWLLRAGASSSELDRRRPARRPRSPMMEIRTRGPLPPPETRRNAVRPADSAVVHRPVAQGTSHPHAPSPPPTWALPGSGPSPVARAGRAFPDKRRINSWDTMKLTFLSLPRGGRS